MVIPIVYCLFVHMIDYLFVHKQWVQTFLSWFVQTNHLRFNREFQYKKKHEIPFYFLTIAHCDVVCMNHQVGRLQSLHPLHIIIWYTRCYSFLTALHLATDKSNYDIMELLLDKGAKVNALDNLGQTALHRAAQQGNVQACQLLMAYNIGIYICRPPLIKLYL